MLATLLFCLLALPVGAAGASALQIRPLSYPANPAEGFEKLVPGETKKGFVDISNGSPSPVTVQFSVKGFKQVDNQGSLQFFESEDLQAGIQLDFKEIELKAGEALRLFFVIDGSKLPPGDVFAGIFASTVNKGQSGMVSSAQVGTLLLLENGQGGPRQADIAGISVPFFHFGDDINGKVAIKNTAQPNKATGFFPKATIALGPLFEQSIKVNGPLIFAGVTRDVPFAIKGDRIGVYKVQISAGESTAHKWIVVVTGYWRWAVAAMGAVVAVLVVYLLSKRSRNRTRKGLRFSK